MTTPGPINIARIEEHLANQLGREIVRQQVASKSRFAEEVETGFNPEAVKRQQSRLDKFKSLEERRKVPKAEKQSENAPKRTDEDLASRYNRRNSELNADKLRELRENLRQNETTEEILQDVLESFEDPTLADEALEYLDKETDGRLQSNVRAARDLLSEQKGREIIAGRNVDAAAKAFYKKGIGNSATDLRNLYRNITGNPRDHNVLFAELSEDYSYDQLKLVVAFLLKGLAYDLKSKGPSIQHAELMRLMTDTRNLQSILWVYLFFKSRMKLIGMLFGQFEEELSEDLTFEALAKEFIKLVEERYPSVMKLLKQAEKLGLSNDTMKMIILMQYRDAVRNLSPRLYKSLRHRHDLLLVIIEALEELEDEKEEERG